MLADGALPTGLFRCFCTLILLLVAAPPMHAAGPDERDFDSYKLRITGYWFYAQPSGKFEGKAHNGALDLSRDVNFQTYSTFSGKLDWKFARKHHFILAATPFDTTQQRVLNRTVNFQGRTFDVGLATSTDLQVNGYSVGYQYDFIRRRQGHLGLVLQMDLLDTKATISAAAQVVGGVQRAAVSASGSLLAPIPVAGPDFRVYLIPNSSRLFLTGNVLGMYLFGYGNFFSANGTLGLTLSKHLSLRAGYQLGTRLTVNDRNDRIGVRLSQKGAIVGADFSF
jgi:hypothetical protein